MKVIQLQIINAVLLNLRVYLIRLSTLEHFQYTLLRIKIQQWIDHLLVLLQSLGHCLGRVIRPLD
jgi:hypothetical protein